MASALLILATACTEKEAPKPKQYTVKPGPAAQQPAPTPEAPPVPPPTAAPTPEVKPAGGAEMVESGPAAQSRYDRNAKWFKALASGDASAKARVADEMKKANLSKAELAEFEKLKKYYGIK